MERKEITQIKALREGGQVKRCHTFPIVGGDYTVGKHSFDAVNLLLILCPNASKGLMKAILWHDVAERWVGDIPATAKWQNENLDRASKIMEENTMIQFGLQEPFDNLQPSEKEWLTAVDRLELWIWAREQRQLGNIYAEKMKNRIEEWFEDNDSPAIEVCKGFMQDYDPARLEDDIYEAV